MTRGGYIMGEIYNKLGNLGKMLVGFNVMPYTEQEKINAYTEYEDFRDDKLNKGKCFILLKNVLKVYELCNDDITETIHPLNDIKKIEKVFKCQYSLFNHKQITDYEIKSAVIYFENSESIKMGIPKEDCRKQEFEQILKKIETHI